GMGIDYGIHFYARYIEMRSDGKAVLDSLFKTYDSTGAGIFVSALTTAFSLFILVIARFLGFSGFGFIAGSGIILALLCMLYVLPVFLLISERYNWILLNENRDAGDESSTLFTRFPLARPVVVVGLLAALVAGIYAPGMNFQYDFGE